MKTGPPITLKANLDCIHSRSAAVNVCDSDKMSHGAHLDNTGSSLGSVVQIIPLSDK